MPDFKPTPEQDEIVSFARDETQNLIVVARAGAAKTSTLVLIAEAIPDKEILCLAFNKSIALEMADRLPNNCTSKTLHSLGYAAWRQFTGLYKLNFNGKKTYSILRNFIEQLDPEDKKEAYDSIAETLKFLSDAKNCGYLPQEYKGHWRPLIDDESFFLSLEMEPSHLQEILINQTLIESFKRALKGEIDFDDMIYCPALCAVSWPKFPLTLIDEAQDLSPINHHILRKLVRNNRLIAVGDPCQAIYGFRGALADSMDKLTRMFNMHTLHLTISFRCARSITENAQWLAPDMRAPEWAEEGEVLRPTAWSVTDLLDGDAIICRNNAPLFSMAIRLIECDRLPELSGRDLAAPLKKIMSKLGKNHLPRIAALDALEAWKSNELRRARQGAAGQVHDRASCIAILLEKTKTLGDAVAYLDHLMTRDGRIYLMTGHKSKGLEFDNVFFLDQHFCRIKHEQDANIKYVIETRAKKKLTYVQSDAFIGAFEEVISNG